MSAWQELMDMLEPIQFCRRSLTCSPLAFDWGGFDGCPDIARFVKNDEITPNLVAQLRRFGQYRRTMPMCTDQWVRLAAIADRIERWLTAEVPS